MYLKSLVSGSELLWSLIEEFDAENDEGVDMESDEEEDDEMEAGVSVCSLLASLCGLGSEILLSVDRLR